ncbi:hypothetical protein D3C78_1901740 [compost metagenome]
MVRVLPSGVTAVCGKPATLPPLTTVMPPTVRVCRPSRALTVNVPTRVRADVSGLVPSLRFFS